MTRKLARVLAAVFFFVLLLPSSTGCPIILPLPTKTMADKVLEANTIVLAREAEDEPFTYSAHTALRGNLEDAEEIGLFMNSTIRRHLNSFPDRNIVLVRLLEGEKQVWKIIGTPDPEFEKLVNEILTNAEQWKVTPQTRLDYFKKRLNHSNNAIREQAYLEIGRAPYSEIRKMQGIMSSQEIYSYLKDIRYYNWNALHILLLGLSDDNYDHEIIKDSFYNAAHFNRVRNLAAWTAAYLEIEPEEALAAIDRMYFANPDRATEELKAIILATATHGSEGHIYLRDQIIEGYKVILQSRPELASSVVEALIKWKRWECVDMVKEILKNPPSSFDYSSSMALRFYIRFAKASPSQ